MIVARALFAPADADYLRYVDSFTNVSDETRLVEAAWGGAAGAYEDGGLVAVAATSSGDRRIDAADTFVTVMQNAKRVDDPMRGPSGHGPSAHVLGSRGGVLNRVGDMYARSVLRIDGPDTIRRRSATSSRSRSRPDRQAR